MSGTLGAHEKVQVVAGVLRGCLPSFLPSFGVEPLDCVAGLPALILFIFCQVPITFLPRDGGDYAQFWDLECHPVSEPQQKSRVRFQLCGTVSTPLLPLQTLQWLHSLCSQGETKTHNTSLRKARFLLLLRSQQTKVLIKCVGIIQLKKLFVV